jgi:hypothetical protein
LLHNAELYSCIEVCKFRRDVPVMNGASKKSSALVVDRTQSVLDHASQVIPSLRLGSRARGRRERPAPVAGKVGGARRDRMRRIVLGRDA